MDWSAVSVATKAALPPVTSAEMKSHLRVDFADDDTDVAAAVLAATAFIERQTGVALVTQTWRYGLDSFTGKTHNQSRSGASRLFGYVYQYGTCDNIIELPGWPIQSVTSVNYYDGDGTAQTVDANEYRVDLNREPVRIFHDTNWPTSESRSGAVWVDYVVGVAVADVAPDLLAGVKLMAAHLFENREAVGEKMDALPLGIDFIIESNRRGYAAA